MIDTISGKHSVPKFHRSQVACVRKLYIPLLPDSGVALSREGENSVTCIHHTSKKGIPFKAKVLCPVIFAKNRLQQFHSYFTFAPVVKCL